MLCELPYWRLSVKKVGLRSQILARSIKIKTYEGGTKYFNNDVLEVGYQKKAKDYNSNIFDSKKRMKAGHEEAWLDQLEATYKGFDKDHNTYYGFVPENQSNRE